jgi:hypothetical protein
MDSFYKELDRLKSLPPDALDLLHPQLFQGWGCLKKERNETLKRD